MHLCWKERREGRVVLNELRRLSVDCDGCGKGRACCAGGEPPFLFSVFPPIFFSFSFLWKQEDVGIGLCCGVMLIGIVAEDVRKSCMNVCAVGGDFLLCHFLCFSSKKFFFE